MAPGGRGAGMARLGRVWLVIALALAAAFGAVAAPAAAQDVDVDLGTLPAGKRVRVFFDATIDDPTSAPLVMAVENQGTVSSNTSAFGAIATDDPDDPTSVVDPTRTTLDGLSVGNQVWRDDNGNAVFDGSPTDTPLGGVTVNLYLDDGDGVLDAGDGAPIATTVTAFGGGLYSFGGLQMGDYIVEIAACNATGVGCPAVLAGLASIAPVPAADPDDDVDHDDNGDILMPPFGVAAKAVTLDFNTEPPATLPDGDADTDTNLTVDFGFAPVADVEIVTKADSPDPVIAGNNVTYTLQFRNNGPGAASTVMVTDPTPTGTTFVSAMVTVGSGWMISTPVVGATGNVVFSKPSVAPSETATFTVTVQVDPSVGDGSTIMNTATASAASFDPDNSNDAKSASTSVTTSADVELTSKTDAPDPVTAGENLAYTINYKNNGPSNAASVQVKDTLPAGTTFVSANLPAGWGSIEPPVGGTGTVTWLRTSSPAGEMVAFTLTVKVDPSIADGATIDNTATVTTTTSDPGPGADSAMASTTVAAEADLTLTKTDDVDPAVPGGTVVYTLTASNAGPSDAVNVQVTDTLPAGMTFVSTSGCDNDPNGFPTCDLGAVAAGGMKAYTLTVTVDTPVAAGVTSVTNEATVSTTTTESSSANNDASEATAITAAPDLSISKTDGDTTSFPGGVIAYEISFENVGDQDATGVAITETVPAGTTFNEPASGGAGIWSCADGAPATTVCKHSAGAVAAGSAASMVTFAVTVSPSVTLGPTREISNTATIADDGANGLDPSTLNNEATDTTPLPVDFGDAPDPLDATAGLYPTLFANGGPRHAIRPVGDPLRVFLGAAVDDDSDGQPSPPLTPAADGDDTDFDGDDEDGVVFTSGLLPGAASDVTVTASAAGLLNAWIDFDVDGVFAPGEQVFTDEPLAAGANSLSVSTPAGALTGPTADLLEGTFARFRFDTTGGLGPTGQSDHGEVEDHFAPIDKGPPVFSKVFSPDSIGEGFETTLSFSIDNTGKPAATNLAFDDMLTFDLRIADEPMLGNTCGGTVTTGTTTIDLSGGTVAEAATCSVSVRVFAPTHGVFDNTSSDLTSSAGNSGPATDTLTVLECTAMDGSNLTLPSGVTLMPESYEVCNTITVPEHVQVLGPHGSLELRAGVAVIFSNGVEIGPDGVLEVTIDPALVP